MYYLKNCGNPNEMMAILTAKEIRMYSKYEN